MQEAKKRRSEVVLIVMDETAAAQGEFLHDAPTTTTEDQSNKQEGNQSLDEVDLNENSSAEDATDKLQGCNTMLILQYFLLFIFCFILFYFYFHFFI